VIKVDPDEGPWPELAGLARIIEDGGLVAFPTETVYGIAVNLRDQAATRRLCQAKGRPDAKPLTVHLPNTKAIAKHIRDLPLTARKLTDRFWPGPLTLVTPDRHGRPTGFRVPNLPVAQALLSAGDFMIGATSANPSSEPPARTATQVLGYFDGVLDAVIDAGPCRHGTGSSVVRVGVEGEVEVLREGVIPEREIREATAHTILFVCSGNRCRSPLAAAFATRLLAARRGVDPHDLLLAGLRVESAGTACMKGEPASAEAVDVGERHGLEISHHRSRSLTLNLVEDADEIYVMTGAHRDSICEFSPDARARIRPLDPKGRDIPDPYGQGPAAYSKIAVVVEEAVQARLRE